MMEPMKHNLWKHQATAILGGLVLILPLTGVPFQAKAILYVVAGLFITVFTLAAMRADSAAEDTRHQTPTEQ